MRLCLVHKLTKSIRDGIPEYRQIWGAALRCSRQPCGWEFSLCYYQLVRKTTWIVCVKLTLDMLVKVKFEEE